MTGDNGNITEATEVARKERGLIARYIRAHINLIKNMETLEQDLYNLSMDIQCGLYPREGWD